MAETCDACHTYAKMLYQARDMQLDPFADDLATLGLDLLVADAGWAPKSNGSTGIGTTRAQVRAE